MISNWLKNYNVTISFVRDFPQNKEARENAWSSLFRMTDVHEYVLLYLCTTKCISVNMHLTMCPKDFKGGGAAAGGSSMGFADLFTHMH